MSFASDIEKLMVKATEASCEMPERLEAAG